MKTRNARSTGTQGILKTITGDRYEVAGLGDFETLEQAVLMQDAYSYLSGEDELTPVNNESSIFNKPDKVRDFLKKNKFYWLQPQEFRTVCRIVSQRQKSETGYVHVSRYKSRYRLSINLGYGGNISKIHDDPYYLAVYADLFIMKRRKDDDNADILNFFWSTEQPYPMEFWPVNWTCGANMDSAEATISESSMSSDTDSIDSVTGKSSLVKKITDDIHTSNAIRNLKY